MRGPSQGDPDEQRGGRGGLHGRESHPRGAVRGGSGEGEALLRRPKGYREGVKVWPGKASRRMAFRKTILAVSSLCDGDGISHS